MVRRIIFSIFITIMLCGLTGCHDNKPPDGKVTAPLIGEFITADGSKLTFISKNDNDWSTGEVLVELSEDAEYLLEERTNNVVYRYVFGMNNLPANYDVADDFGLTDGKEWFFHCHSKYTADEIILKPYSPYGDELIFKLNKSED